MDRREETVRRLTEAWNGRDVDAILALATPDPVYANPPNAVEPGIRRGRDEVAEVFRKQWEMLGDARMEIDRIVVRPDDVIVEARISRRMPGSAATVDNKGLMKVVHEAELIARMEVLGGGSDYDEALRAAGLGEDA